MTSVVPGQPFERRTTPPATHQAPIAQRLPNNPTLTPPPRINAQRPINQRQTANSAQLASQHHIIHQRHLGKTAGRLETLPPDKQPLITVGHLTSSRPPRIPSLQPPKQPTTSINLLAKGTTHHARIVQCLVNLGSGFDRQPAIRVQKQQHITVCCPNPHILLHGPSRATRNQVCTSLDRKATGLVLATTIDNDHFNRASCPGR